MPELPEVEVAARVVRACLVGRVIREVTVHDPRIVRQQSAAAFRRAMRSRTLVAVDRRGKHLMLRCDEGTAAWLHLGMTGKLVAVPKGARAPAHTRVSLHHEAGRLCFRDPRIFGGVTAGPLDAVRESSRWDRLGIDALDVGQSGARLRAALDPEGVGRRPIKVVLMDQHRLAGVGNIYAVEALFRARIAPTTPVSRIDRPGWGRLARGLSAALRETLEGHGDGQITYLNEGGVDNPFRVYARAGEPCPRCGTPIERSVQGGRATFSCRQCQPEHPLGGLTST